MHDADDGSEQPDERCRRADRGEDAEIFFELGDGNHRGAIHALTCGFERHFRIDGPFVAPRGLKFEQTRGDDLGQMAVFVFLGDVDRLLIVAARQNV